MMEWLSGQEIGALAREYAPVIATLLVSVAVLGGAQRLLRSREDRRDDVSGVSRQIVMLALSAAALLLVTLALPIRDELREQLLSLFGLLLTGVIAFSSTTLVANVMAGFMLRGVRNFRPGDFVRVGDQFGRVTERGLFHVEIQTEDGDLSTLPNLYLVTHPVTVLRASGTVVSATLSLGYDVAHAQVEALALRAAERCGLSDPFVLILELGDFAVTYRVAGFLPDVKTILSTRSRLRACLLDTLHAAGIEIVSPTFMNQRRVEAGRFFVPREPRGAPAPPDSETHPEERIFDKAEEVGAREALRSERRALVEEIRVLETKTSEHVDPILSARRARLEALSRELDEGKGAED